MRADRLLSLVLLLRNRGRMSASALARELEVSPRTVLRDIEALSTSGIPVYAERGRDGGFELLPGFTTDLTGLTVEESKALLTAGSTGASESLGMAPAFASAMRKVMAAMPDTHRAAASKVAERILVSEGGWFLEPRREENLGLVQQAVFAGRRIRITYAPRDKEPAVRVVDPIGLVNALGYWYLVALHDGQDRTYRLSRMSDVEMLDEPADRPKDVDLRSLWVSRRERFRSTRNFVTAVLRVRTTRVEAMLGTTVAIRSNVDTGDGWSVVEAEFGDVLHAANTAWLYGDDCEVVSPPHVRDAVRERALRLAARHGEPFDG